MRSGQTTGEACLDDGKLRDNRPSKATRPAATAEKDQGHPLDDAELVKHPKMGQIFRRAGIHLANVGLILWLLGALR